MVQNELLGKPTYISLQELQKYNKRDGTWIAIDGKIYDASKWAKHHPGGEFPLLSFAGQEVTEAFLTFHPPTAYNHLNTFFTGSYLRDYAVSDVSRDYRDLFYELTKMGFFEYKGRGVLLMILLIVVMLFVSVCGVLFSDSSCMSVCCGGLMGFLWIQSGWISHDSCHYQIMANPNWNWFVQILSGNFLSGITYKHGVVEMEPQCTPPCL